MPHLQPTSAKLKEMGQRTSQVIHFLKDLHHLLVPDTYLPNYSVPASANDHHPTTRPWEDTSNEAGPASDGTTESTTEADMAHIRNKCATMSSQNRGSSQIHDPEARQLICVYSASGRLNLVR